MVCEKCGKEAASVHVTKIVNGQKNEVHLCQDCAREVSDFGSGIDIPNLFASFFDHPQTWGGATVKAKCTTCGSTLADLQNLDQLGCSDCYTTFKVELQPLLRRLHGTNKHIGKVPVRGYQKLSLDRKVEALREQLTHAIAIEKYEEAAQLRDQIRKLENESEKEGEE